jgi:hypothetical protein
MKGVKRVVIAIVCLSIVGLLVLSRSFEFHKEYERPGSVLLPDSIYAFARQYISSTNATGVSRECAKVTCKLLKFSFNQDVLFENKVSKAHCVTYARLCATLCNTFYKELGIDAEAIPVVGRVTVCGIDIHKILTSLLPKEQRHNFVNHDMVEIRSKGETIWFIDPVEREFFGVERVYNVSGEKNSGKM